jgi:hypothetical protein
MVIDDFFRLRTYFAEVLISNPDIRRYEGKLDRVLLVKIES